MSKLEEYKELIDKFYLWKDKIDEVMENGDGEWFNIVKGIDEGDEWYGCVYGDINEFLRGIIE